MPTECEEDVAKYTGWRLYFTQKRRLVQRLSSPTFGVWPFGCRNGVAALLGPAYGNCSGGIRTQSTTFGVAGVECSEPPVERE